MCVRVCVCSITAAIKTSKCFENKLVSQSQHPVVYLKICLSFIYDLLNWKLKPSVMYHQVCLACPKNAGESQLVGFHQLSALIGGL